MCNKPPTLKYNFAYIAALQLDRKDTDEDNCTKTQEKHKSKKYTKHNNMQTTLIKRIIIKGLSYLILSQTLRKSIAESCCFRMALW